MSKRIRKWVVIGLLTLVTVGLFVSGFAAMGDNLFTLMATMICLTFFLGYWAGWTEANRDRDEKGKPGVSK